MIDQSLVQTGFDLEFLVGEKYFQYLLLSLCETGSIPNWVEAINPATGEDSYIIIHRPEELETQRRYRVYDGYQPYPGGGTFIFENAVSDAFTVTIIPAFVDVAIIQVKIWVSMAPKARPDDISIPIPIVLNLRIRLDKTTDNGFDKDIKLNFELYGVQAPFEFLQTTEQELMSTLKPWVDRDAPLTLAGGNGGIHTIKMRTSSPSDRTPPVIGFYINLKLKDGPEGDNYLDGERGDYFLAKNFLPEGQHMAFAFNHDVYRRLGRDIKFRMAELREGTTDQYYYPVMIDGHQKGSIKSVTVAPGAYAEFGLDPVHYTNELVITIHGDYEWHSFYPDFYFRIRLTPQMDENGILTWRSGYGLSVPSLDIVGSIFEGLLAFTIAGIPLAIGVYLLKEDIIEGAKDQILANSESDIKDANFMDLLPSKLPVETWRWDPLYNTTHQVVSGIDEVLINDKGFAMSAGKLFVAKEFDPINHVVIRDKKRDESNKIISLLYRVKDYNSNQRYTDSFAAVDRMPFLHLPPQGDESHRVELFLERKNGILDRLTNNKIRQNITYAAKKVDIMDNQVFRILCISSTEIGEISDAVKRRLINENREPMFEWLWNKAIGELILDGNFYPTVDEIKKRFEIVLAAYVDSISAPFIEEEIARHLLFELEPDEMGKMQVQKILTLLNLDLIRMRSNKYYFRDHADGNLADNLLSRPTYMSEERATG